MPKMCKGAAPIQCASQILRSMKQPSISMDAIKSFGKVNLFECLMALRIMDGHVKETGRHICATSKETKILGNLQASSDEMIGEFSLW